MMLDGEKVISTGRYDITKYLEPVTPDVHEASNDDLETIATTANLIDQMNREDPLYQPLPYPTTPERAHETNTPLHDECDNTLIIAVDLQQELILPHPYAIQWRMLWLLPQDL